jgi:uncharacterized membrane protein YphA (DoxX/SURF4 family)
MNPQAHTYCSQVALKFTYGLLFIVAGADKFLNLVTHWAHYVSPFVERLLPMPVQTFLYGVGIFEIIVGILILNHFTKIGAYIAMAWLLIIAVNLVTMGRFFDIAVRDVVMAVGAFVLAQLTECKECEKH